jgi:hypothetical protein
VNQFGLNPPWCYDSPQLDEDSPLYNLLQNGSGRLWAPDFKGEGPRSCYDVPALARPVTPRPATPLGIASLPTCQEVTDAWTPSADDLADDDIFRM